MVGTLSLPRGKPSPSASQKLRGARALKWAKPMLWKKHQGLMGRVPAGTVGSKTLVTLPQLALANTRRIPSRATRRSLIQRKPIMPGPEEAAPSAGAQTTSNAIMILLPPRPLLVIQTSLSRRRAMGRASIPTSQAVEALGEARANPHGHYSWRAHCSHGRMAPLARWGAQCP